MVNETRYREAEHRYWESEGVTPTEQWLDLRATRTRVRVQIHGDGPPVVFVHGVMNGGTSWGPLVARLRGFRCIMLDRPGTGLSAPLVNRVDGVDAFGALADSLIVDVLDALELDRAHLVATSLGGFHALRTVTAHPDRIDRVVALGWTLGAPIGAVPVLMRLGGVRSLGKLMSRMPVNDRAVRSMLKQSGLRPTLAAGRVTPEMLGWYRALVADTNTIRNELDGAPRMVHPVRGVNTAVLFDDDLLARVQTPIRFIWGTEDPFGGADVASRFVERIPGATLEMIPGGHAVWLDDPERVAAATAEFLRG